MRRCRKNSSGGSGPASGSAATPVAVYQARDGAIELRQDTAHETVWATQAQVAKIFGISRPVVSKHIKRLFKDKEISKNINVQKMHINRAINMHKMHINPRGQPTWAYSLDVILAAAYRTNSARAIKFRRWANDVLKRYLVEGYAVDRKRLAESAARLTELREAVEEIAATGNAAKTLDDVPDEYASSEELKRRDADDAIAHDDESQRKESERYFKERREAEAQEEKSRQKPRLSDAAPASYQRPEGESGEPEVM